MKIFHWLGLGLWCAAATAMLIAGWLPAAADAAAPTLSARSPDAVLRALGSAVPPAPPLSLPEPTATAPEPTTTPTVAIPDLLLPPGPDATASVSGIQARGHAALARVAYDLSSVGYTISFHPANASHLGLTFTRRRHIEIYVRPSLSDAELAYVIGHEMGHAVDHIRNTSADRHRWSALRGMNPTEPWWPVGTGTDLATPAGDFAECFAVWATGSASHSAWGGCGSAMTLVAELAND